MEKADDGIAPLDAKPLQALRDLVKRIHEHKGPWSVTRGGERNDDGSVQMRWVEMSDVCADAMAWLYEHERVVMFNWAVWDEGRVIFHQWTPETTSTLDHLTTRKLLTAVARSDRFNEGAWVGLFEKGIGPLLFARLLEHEEALAGG